jgi:hypothetical protein
LFPEQHSKNWVKRIQEEWKLLEKDLPGKVVFSVFLSRMGCNIFLIISLLVFVFFKAGGFLLCA